MISFEHWHSLYPDICKSALRSGVPQFETHSLAERDLGTKWTNEGKYIITCNRICGSWFVRTVIGADVVYFSWSLKKCLAHIESRVKILSVEIEKNRVNAIKSWSYCI